MSAPVSVSNYVSKPAQIFLFDFSGPSVSCSDAEAAGEETLEQDQPGRQREVRSELFQ